VDEVPALEAHEQNPARRISPCQTAGEKAMMETPQAIPGKLNTRHKGRGIWCSGVRGTGKSTIMETIIRNYPADHFLGFDHQGEYAERLNAFSCKTWEQAEACWRQKKAVLFDPRYLYPGIKEVDGKQIPHGQSEAFREWCRRSWRWINEDPFATKLWWFDETGGSVPVSAAYNSHEARPIVEQGRVRGCDLLWSTQQTNQANNQLRNQCTEIFAFRHADKTACEWLITKGFSLDELTSLQDGEFLYKLDRLPKIERGTIALGK
jgi:hypothetical protein